ncbi:MAG: alpha/beta fold hydrolase [Chloroflexi bacterium]|nr:alpha/beta fold hydrolase [Chloroflexota bacterium]
MADFLIDNPLILSMLFHPRRAVSGGNSGAHDGTLAVAADAALGYRLHYGAEKALIVFFHGNGEVASDYDDLAPLFRECGAALLVLDYRGYGWSTGRPLGSTLLPDAEAAFRALPAALAGHGVPADLPLYVMGRSLGSAPALHLAYTFAQQLRGLILDSAFAHTPSLLAGIGIPRALLQAINDPFANERKIASVQMPTLLIHGEHDTLIPLEHGERLYAASPAAHKTLLRIARAGHNDLLYHGMQAYFAAIKTLLAAV